MLRLLTPCLAASLLFIVACGGDSGTSDTGTPGIDAPSPAPDALGDRPDAPGLDAPVFPEDAFSADDAPVVVTEDAPTSVDDAPLPAADALANADAPASGAFCGGIASIPCRDPREYCDESCTMPDAGGVCRLRPDVCTDELDPVCGCDGRTYGNPCMAAAAGASVRSPGACPGGADCRTDGCSMPGQECCTGGRSAGRCYDPRCLSCCM